MMTEWVMPANVQTPRQKAKNLLKEIADSHSVDYRDVLNGRSRSDGVMPARWEACYKLKTVLGLSLSRIAKIMNLSNEDVVLKCQQHHEQVIKESQKEA